MVLMIWLMVCFNRIKLKNWTNTFSASFSCLNVTLRQIIALWSGDMWLLVCPLQVYKCALLKENNDPTPSIQLLESQIIGIRCSRTIERWIGWPKKLFEWMTYLRFVKPIKKGGRLLHQGKTSRTMKNINQMVKDSEDEVLGKSIGRSILTEFFFNSNLLFDTMKKKLTIMMYHNTKVSLH